jgi:prevent-host-death family protein
LVTVKTMSLAKAKARISELVDRAEHRGRGTVILRHGRPAAAIVPLHVAAPAKQEHRAMTDAEALRSVEEFIAEFSAAEPGVSAVADLRAGRR